MPYYLGIDTSNYTTSAALYSPEKGVVHKKKLLPVKKGECGLRQSDAVFHHVQQLPGIIEELFSEFEGEITAIGVSSVPRDAENSYMPCFTVGLSTARILSKTLKVPLYTFSHQSGHIAAAVFSAGCTGLLGERFLAFHVSGGTTEAVIAEPHPERVISETIAAKTLDLNAGQLIDRVGVMLGLDFPCGRELEQLALKHTAKLPRIRATLKDSDCCMSGIENICRKAYENGASKEETAALCLEYVEKTIEEMCLSLLKKFGDIPVVFAGGVMSDAIIKEKLSKKINAYFALPEFSADNAAGTAFLCSIIHKNNKGDQ